MSWWWTCAGHSWVWVWVWAVLSGHHFHFGLGIWAANTGLFVATYNIFMNTIIWHVLIDTNNQDAVRPISDCHSKMSYSVLLSKIYCCLYSHTIDFLLLDYLNSDKVPFLKEGLAQSIIFNTAILGKWIKLCLNFHFPNALTCWQRWVDMFSVLTVLRVWTHNGWFYTCTTYVRCTWIMWVGEADKQLSRKYVFILTPKHIATSVLWFKFLSFYVGIKYAFYTLTFAKPQGRCHY